MPDPARVVPVDLSAHEVPQVLLDVREVPEREESVKHEGSLHLPLSQLSDAEGSLLPATDVPAELLSLFESVRDQRVGVFCASGARAQRVVQAYAELAGEYGAQEVKLPAGHLVLYPAGSLHQVLPVTRGARVAAFFWIQSMVRDDGQRAQLYDLDQSVQSLAAQLGIEHPDVVRLSGLYHNLIRRWADT